MDKLIVSQSCENKDSSEKKAEDDSKICKTEYFIQGFISDVKRTAMIKCLEMADPLRAYKQKGLYDLVSIFPTSSGTPNEFIRIRRPMVSFKNTDLISYLGPMRRVKEPHQVAIRSRVDFTANWKLYDWIEQLDFYRARHNYVAQGFVYEKQSVNLTTLRVYRPFDHKFPEGKKKFKDLVLIHPGYIVELSIYAPNTKQAEENSWKTIKFFKQFLQPYVTFHNFDINTIDAYSETY